jgi:hypothetical protein
MPLADSTDALSSYQESHEYNEQYQQHQYDPNLYYDPYQHQQQNEVDGGQQHQYEQMPQENNQQVSFYSYILIHLKHRMVSESEIKKFSL